MPSLGLHAQVLNAQVCMLTFPYVPRVGGFAATPRFRCDYSAEAATTRLVRGERATGADGRARAGDAARRGGLAARNR